MKKLIIAILLLFSVPAFGQEALQKVRIEDFSGGMVTNSLADILEPKQGVSLTNVVISKPGKISKRKGQALFVKDVGNTAFNGVGRFDPDANTSYLVAASGVSVIRAAASSTDWVVANPSNALTPGKRTEFVQANNLFFVLNGFDNPAWYNGSAWTAGSTYPTSPPTAQTGAWLRNYLFLAGNPQNRDWVYFSNNLSPAVFSASDLLKINTGDGQGIQRVIPYRLNELIIYKDRSIFVLDITGTTPLSDWTVQPITKTFGLIAPKSVVVMGDDQWFLSSNPIAIRSLVRSQFDKILTSIISQPIQDIFENTGPLAINRTYISGAAGVFFDSKYMLAIPTGTSQVNNTVLVYDFLAQGWYIITGWYPKDWIVFDERLFFIDANDGRVMEAFSGNTGDFEPGPNFIDSASTPTVGIDFNYISKTLDFDNKENFKQADALELEFEPTGNQYADVYISMDGGPFTSIGTVSLSGNLDLPFILPAQLQGAGVARKTFQLQRYGEFKKIQVRVNQNWISQGCTLQRATVFAVPRKWRRE